MKSQLAKPQLKLDLNEKSNMTRLQRSDFASLKHPKANVKSINGIDWDAFIWKRCEHDFFQHLVIAYNIAFTHFV